ncbi:sulfatase [Belliella marina]|uniref:Sulfatase n=1 Tax=Belliella marina TaxID=1644146 RepID=A0ABW4VP92_9BACT
MMKPKLHHIYFFAICILLISCEKPKKKEVERPNILYIMADDHAVQAISAYGHPISKLAPTPNIDRIAKAGVLFTANYCANSICGPSRASILTGKHSHANGFMQNNNEGFDGSQATLAKIFRENGYQTSLIGKWHLVSEPTGFDHWQILNDQGEYNNPDFVTSKDTVKISGYVTDIITELTVDWLDQRDPEKPFFLMMQHKAPHRSWIPAERHYNLYDDVEFPVPNNYFDDYEGRFAAANQEMNVYRDMFEGHDLKLSIERGVDSLRFDPWSHVFFGRMTPEEIEKFWDAYREKNDAYFEIDPSDSVSIAEWKLQRYLQDYLAVIKAVDESVGKILDYLEENDLVDNTLVVYTTDQGFYLGEHGWFDKRFMYEESFIMPTLMQYPGKIEAGISIPHLTQNIDFAPSFLDICGIAIPGDMHGASFKPLLFGGLAADWRSSIYYHYYEFPGIHNVRAHYGVKEERYKLIYFYKEDIWELYDLQNDPTEMKNIYGNEGTEAISERLKTELRKLQDQYAVPDEHR